MPIFEYEALNGSGKAIRGIIDAESARTARTKLKNQGVYPTEIREESAALAQRGPALRLFGRVRAKDLAQVFRQMATLMEAGIPLVSSLSALIDQSGHPYLRTTLTQIRERVREGSSLADALTGSSPDLLRPFYRIGEGRRSERDPGPHPEPVGRFQRAPGGPAPENPGGPDLSGVHVRHRPGGSFFSHDLRGPHGDQDLFRPRPVPSLAHPDPDRGERLSEPLLVGGGGGPHPPGLLAAEIPAERIGRPSLGPPEIEAPPGPGTSSQAGRVPVGADPGDAAGRGASSPPGAGILPGSGGEPSPLPGPGPRPGNGSGRERRWPFL